MNKDGSLKIHGSLKNYIEPHAALSRTKPKKMRVYLKWKDKLSQRTAAFGQKHHELVLNGLFLRLLFIITIQSIDVFVWNEQIVGKATSATYHRHFIDINFNL